MKLSTAGAMLSLAWALLCCGVAPDASAATCYVRNDGHDTASGLNNTTNVGTGAWQTLQHAADSVSAGDTVHVADGTYVGFMIQTAGTAGSPITFKAQGSGASITTRNATTDDGINIESWGDDPADYVTIDGFRVRGIGRMGIRAIAGTGIVIRNCTVHDNGGCGIFSGGTPHIQVLDNTTYGNGDTLLEHNICIGDRGVVFEGAGNHASNNYSASSAGTLFADYVNHDYHLASGSAAIGCGVVSYQGQSAPADDKDGNARSAPYDAGAYEFPTADVTAPAAPRGLAVK